MNLGDLNPQEFEDLCTHCGKCCTEKVIVEDTIYISKKFCRFFDKAEMRCSVYEDRFTAEPGCCDVKKGTQLGIFPSDCPYVEGLSGYKAAVDVWTDPAITEEIREVLGDDAV